MSTAIRSRNTTQIAHGSLRDQRHEMVNLDDGMSFFEWAAGQYPREHFTVELDPWALSAADDRL